VTGITARDCRDPVPAGAVLARVLGMAMLVMSVAGPPAGCAGAPAVEPAPSVLLRPWTGNPRDLCRAAAQAAEEGLADQIPALLDLLGHEDPAVRTCGYQALVALWGEDPVGYRPYDSPARRAEKESAWRALEPPSGGGERP